MFKVKLKVSYDNMTALNQTPQKARKLYAWVVEIYNRFVKRMKRQKMKSESGNFNEAK